MSTFWEDVFIAAVRANATVKLAGELATKAEEIRAEHLQSRTARIQEVATVYVLEDAHNSPGRILGIYSSLGKAEQMQSLRDVPCNILEAELHS